MKTLIAYYSHSGNNEKVAYDLKERTGSTIYQVCEKKKRNTISILFDVLFTRNSKLDNILINFEEFDSVIFVAPVWGGRIAAPMRAFIEKQKHLLNEFYYVTVCNGDNGQKDKIFNELISITNRSPRSVIELSINNLLPADKKTK